jgi:hypothetical protein
MVHHADAYALLSDKVFEKQSRYRCAEPGREWLQPFS